MVVKEILLRDKPSPRREGATNSSLEAAKSDDKKPTPGHLDSLSIRAF